MPPTFDPTLSGPLHLRSDYDLGRVCSSPHQTGLGLYTEHATARYVRGSRSGQENDVVVVIAVKLFVDDMTFGLLGTDRSVQRFDIGGGSRWKSSLCRWMPIRALNVWKFSIVGSRLTSQFLIIRQERLEPRRVEHQVVDFLWSARKRRVQSRLAKMFAISSTRALRRSMAFDFGICDRRLLDSDRIRPRSWTDVEQGSTRHDRVRITESPDVHQDIKRVVAGDKCGEGILASADYRTELTLVSAVLIPIALGMTKAVIFFSIVLISVKATTICISSVSWRTHISDPSEDIGMEADVILRNI